MKRIAALCLFLLAGAAQAQSLPSPQSVARPVMLVASPALQGLYRHSTLIAVPAGEGHVGFIVNRATDLKLATLFPEHAPSAKVADPVYFGGPERADAIFAVVRRNPGADATPLFGELYIVSSAAAVDRVIERSPNDARYFAGFVGWRPGELSKEIDAGYWYVTDADAALFFRRDTDKVWDELIERLGNGHTPQRGRGFVTARLARSGS